MYGFLFGSQRIVEGNLALEVTAEVSKKFHLLFKKLTRVDECEPLILLKVLQPDNQFERVSTQGQNAQCLNVGDVSLYKESNAYQCVRQSLRLPKQSVLIFDISIF